MEGLFPGERDRERKKERQTERDRQTVREQGEQILKTEGSSREPYSKFHQ